MARVQPGFTKSILIWSKLELKPKLGSNLVYITAGARHIDVDLYLVVVGLC